MNVGPKLWCASEFKTHWVYQADLCAVYQFSHERNSSGLVIVKTLKVAQQLVLEAYLSISVQISSFQREWLEQLHIGSVVIVM